MPFGDFKLHGAFKRKSDAKTRERSARCSKKCFILKRKTKRGTRYVVLERKR